MYLWADAIPKSQISEREVDDDSSCFSLSKAPYQVEEDGCVTSLKNCDCQLVQRHQIYFPPTSWSYRINTII